MFNNETLEFQDDGTTSIDFEEPFVLKQHNSLNQISVSKEFECHFYILFRFECDEDGWSLTVNDEPPYPTFFHQFSPTLIQNLMIKGKIEVSYVGFGSKGN